MSKKNDKTTTPPVTARRYDEAARAEITAFLAAGNTNNAAKAEFGCSAHFAGKLRSAAGLTGDKAPKATKAAPVAAKGKAVAKPVAKAAPKGAPVAAKAPAKAKPAKVAPTAANLL